MRILLCIIMLILPAVQKASLNGVNELDYRFYVIPTAGPEWAELEIVIENNGNIPLHFEFPTSQLFEITITDQSGKEVYVYSKGRYFLQAFQTVSIEPHQSFKRVEKWDYRFRGKRVPPGEYKVNVTLRPASLNDKPVQDRTKLITVQKLYVPEENQTFRHVKIAGNSGEYVITGEAKTKSGVFFYSVEDGHNFYLQEKENKLATADSDWKPFNLQIKLSKEKLPANGSLILNLYEKDNRGVSLHSYPVILERFIH
jgi:hypothetical protein